STGIGLLRQQSRGHQHYPISWTGPDQRADQCDWISPGVVDTPMWDRVDSLFAKYEHRPIGEKKRLVGEAVPYGRMGLPEDHVGAAVFLA
ncbi:MAG: hypothetical protein QOI53_3678, partial [Verrucomicrobiota bacterium]|nr:hypothetical protein [Verrucomicrobiota bacterium]